METFNHLDEGHSSTIIKEELFNFMRKLGYRPSYLELRPNTYNEFKYILSKPIKDELTIN